MKLTLKKAELVNLSQDQAVLPRELTPQIAGGQATAKCRLPDSEFVCVVTTTMLPPTVDNCPATSNNCAEY